VALWVSETSGVLRVIDGEPEELPEYRVLGALAFHGDVVLIEGLHGKAKLCEVKQFYLMMRERGYRWLLARRVGNHRLPWARKIEREGAFQGWNEVDLNEVPD